MRRIFVMILFFVLFNLLFGCGGSVDFRPDNHSLYKKSGKNAPRMRAKGVLFRLHAPAAKSVRLCGSFNNWDSSADPMVRKSNGVWELVKQLPVGYHRYAFYVDNQWVADPDNPDRSVNGFTLSRFEINAKKKIRFHVGPFSARKPGYYYHALQTVSSPDWLKNATSCRIDIRTFTRAGTIRAAIAKLPLLKKLGFTILNLASLQPVSGQQISSPDGQGTLMPVTAYRKLASGIGSSHELKQFVAAAHALGLKIVLEWNAAFVAKSAALSATQTDWFLKRDQPFPDWRGIAWLNYQRPGPRIYMAESMLYWLNTYNIDGFYCRLAGAVPLGVWKELRVMLKTFKNGVVLISDNPSPLHHASAFDMTLNTLFQEFLQVLIKKQAKAYLFEDLFWQQRYSFPKDALRLISFSGKSRLAYPAVALLSSLGRRPYLNFTGKSSKLFFSGKRVGLFDGLARLIALKRKSDALSEGAVFFLRNSAASKVVTIVRKSDLERVLIAVNFSDKPASFYITEKSARKAGLVGELGLFDILAKKNGGKLDFSSQQSIRIPAHGALFYRL